MSSVTNTDRSIGSLKPAAQEACKLFMSACAKAGLKVLITETYRSQERQNYLYEQGRTRAGNIVTWTRSSRHTSGLAWDICKNVAGHEYDDSGFFKSCGDIARLLNITWGGTWKTPDTPHFEVTAGWTAPEIEEEIDMEELNKLKAAVESLTEAVKAYAPPTRYNYIDKNMPSWARATIQELVNEGILSGGEDGLDLDYDMLRILVIMKRLFDSSAKK